MCSRREYNKFRYTGVDVERLETGDILESQEDYVKNLEEIEIEEDSENRRPLTKEEYKEFRGALGKLSWLAEQSRPGICYDVLEMSC